MGMSFIPSIIAMFTLIAMFIGRLNGGDISITDKSKEVNDSIILEDHSKHRMYITEKLLVDEIIMYIEMFKICLILFKQSIGFIILLLDKMKKKKIRSVYKLFILKYNYCSKLIIKYMMSTSTLIVNSYKSTTMKMLYFKRKQKMLKQDFMEGKDPPLETE